MIARAFKPVVVLVGSLYDSNIGASSRAMANMGSDELILIRPQCQITYAAQQAAATGQKALQTRRTYGTWDEFFAAEPDGLRIAFTARDGRGRLVEDFASTLKNLETTDPRWQREGNTIPIYMIFGPEDAGLAGSDLELANFSVSIPTFGDNPSLNLAQAVLLALYTLRVNWGGKRVDYLDQRGEESQFVSAADAFPEESLMSFLTALGFSFSHKKMNVYTIFRRLLLRTVPTVKERRVLEIIFRQAARKLNERPHGEGTGLGHGED